MKSSYPLGHILNPATRYVPAVHTDIAKRFAAERERLKLMEQLRDDNVSHLVILNERRGQV